jgi:hypothetical protein
LLPPVTITVFPLRSGLIGIPGLCTWFGQMFAARRGWRAKRAGNGPRCGGRESP